MHERRLLPCFRSPIPFHPFLNSLQRAFKFRVLRTLFRQFRLFFRSSSWVTFAAHSWPGTGTGSDAAMSVSETAIVTVPAKAGHASADEQCTGVRVTVVILEPHDSTAREPEVEASDI